MQQSEQTTLTGYDATQPESTNSTTNNQPDANKETGKFAFNNISTGDTVTLSTINSTVFTVTRIEENRDLTVAGNDNFIPDVFARIEPVDDSVSDRYIVKNLVGEISVWRTAKTGSAKKSSATNDVTIKHVLSPSE